jgi:hypothetical protein
MQDQRLVRVLSEVLALEALDPRVKNLRRIFQVHDYAGETEIPVVLVVQ